MLKHRPERQPVQQGYGAVMSTDDLGAPPNCEHCLIPMHIVGTAGAPYWRCPSCNLVNLV
jgi:hypothetical protein